MHFQAFVFLSALTGHQERFGSFQTQHKRAHNHQRTFRVIITAAVTARNIRLIAETIITSHTGILHHVEHKTEGKPPHHGLSLLISIECACVEHMPVCIELGKMSGVHYFPNRMTANGPVAEISASVQNPRFLRSQVI